MYKATWGIILLHYEIPLQYEKSRKAIAKMSMMILILYSSISHLKDAKFASLYHTQLS